MVGNAYAKLSRLEAMDKKRDPACELGAKVMKRKGTKAMAKGKPTSKRKGATSKK